MVQYHYKRCIKVELSFTEIRYQTQQLSEGQFYLTQPIVTSEGYHLHFVVTKRISVLGKSVKTVLAQSQMLIFVNPLNILVTLITINQL